MATEPTELTEPGSDTVQHQGSERRRAMALALLLAGFAALLYAMTLARLIG